MGLHYGYIHEADLGDGLGRKPEQFLGRQHYFPIMGTCWESVRGGHHFRAWKQNGTDANSGAWFLGYVRLRLIVTMLRLTAGATTLVPLRRWSVTASEYLM